MEIVRGHTDTSECRTRRLLQAVEPTLRSHLGVPGLGIELVGNLHMKIQNVLEESGDSLSLSSENRLRLVDELAMSIYLVLAADAVGSSVAPSILPPLRQALTNALNDSQGSPTHGRPRVKRRRD